MTTKPDGYRDLLKDSITDSSLQNINKDLYVDLAAVAALLDIECKSMNTHTREIMYETWGDFLYILDLAYSKRTKGIDV